MELFGATTITKKIILKGGLVVVDDGNGSSSGSGVVVGENDAPLTVFETTNYYDYDHTGVIPSNRISCPYTPLEIKEAKRRRKDISKASSSIEKRKITMPLSLSCTVVQRTRATGEQHELKKLADSVFNLVIAIFEVSVEFFVFFELVNEGGTLSSKLWYCKRPSEGFQKPFFERFDGRPGGPSGSWWTIKCPFKPRFKCSVSAATVIFEYLHLHFCGPSLLVHSTTTLPDMADPDSYKKIYIESFRELQRKCDELQRDLTDFRARLRRVLLLPDENCPSDNENMTDPMWDVAILRDAVWELQTQVQDLQWELTAVRGVKMLRMIIGRPGPSGFVSASTADGSNLTAIVTAGNMETANEAKQYILKDNKDARIDIEKLDLSKIRSVEAFADSFKALNLPLSILINNAGVMFCPFQLSEDGIEMQFATNHIGHFYLTNLLIDKMKETAKSTGIQGRIVNVPSLVYQVTYKGGIQLDKINDKNSHRDERAYGQSKLTNFLHSNELSRRLQLQRLDKLYAVPEKLNLERNAIHTYENCCRNVLFELSFTTSA
ncbi:hypothetical protein BC332_23290 [Capsicum chinense]|nr:hypothetical protein BC332_23290 [Capsicum chinense]